MSVSDPVADMLTKIRNASLAKHSSTSVPVSNTKVEICKILKAEGYLGYITPNTYFDILSGEKLRRHLFDNYTLLKIVELLKVLLKV